MLFYFFIFSMILLLSVSGFWELPESVADYIELVRPDRFADSSSSGLYGNSNNAVSI